MNVNFLWDQHTMSIVYWFQRYFEYKDIRELFVGTYNRERGSSDKDGIRNHYWRATAKQRSAFLHKWTLNIEVFINSRYTIFKNRFITNVWDVVLSSICSLILSTKVSINSAIFEVIVEVDNITTFSVKHKDYFAMIQW